MKTKCRCTVCDQIVEEWHDAMCIRCHHNTITAPYRKENEELREENVRLRSGIRTTLANSNEIWFDIVKSYQNRRLVRMTDWFIQKIQSIVLMFHFVVAMLKGTQHSSNRFKKLQ